MHKSMKKTALALWKDESAQGATEYILLLVAVVAVLAIFRDRITETLKGKLESVAGEIANFGG